MALPYSDVTLKLPLKAVSGSAGLSIDIGGSVAKLVYRSKYEYTGGKPHNPKEYETGMGQVHLAMFAREKIPDVIAYIKEKCDIHCANKSNMIYACGLGGNKYGSIFEEAFGLKVKNTSESDNFARGLCFLMEVHGADMLLPQSVDCIKRAECLVELAMHRHEKEGGHKQHYYERGSNISEMEGEDSQYPFLFAMSGSGFAVFKVFDNTGRFSLSGSTLVAGRFYLGLASILTKLQDFPSIHRLVEQSDGVTVDTQYKDIMEGHAANIEDRIMESGMQPNFRCAVMDKLLVANKEDVVLADVVHSVLQSSAESLAHIMYYTARSEGLSKVYITGNFFNTPITREWAQQCVAIKNGLMPKEKAVRLEFVKHGGHIGAIGAFLVPHLQEQNTISGST